ncbi:MAG: HPr family phosphocarrier protein [Chitinivibrionales bacterium]|nr:HPr family phosphocarrier protein [Chitinivibrionales bacterium]MBD3395905.1 HPr family phosphocarrier protein [Chitinivibrionales bacterium]
MTEKEIVVSNSLGIHARPASLIVQTATRYRSEVTLEKDGATADAKSIMSVMMLAAGKASRVRIRADGPDEQEAVDALAGIFENKFDEE